MNATDDMTSLARPAPDAEGTTPTSSTLATPSSEFLALIPQEFARRHLVLSRGRRDGREELAVAPSTMPAIVHNVGVRLGIPVDRHEVNAEDLAAAIDHAYNASRPVNDSRANDSPIVHVEGVRDPHDVAGELADAVRNAEADLLSTAGKSPVVRLVDLVLFEALQKSASDVHVQPLRDRTLVLYRLDGALHTARELPASLASAVVSRVKVMARLDVAERRAPQDGRAGVTIGVEGSTSGSRRIDLRVSTLPTAFGERLVIRLLDPVRSPHLSSFTALGMPPVIERAYLAQAARTSGIVLSTGPTGSGKTTTLYATLNWISATNAGEHAASGDRRCELNIMTIEDPIEYELCAARRESGPPLAVSQTQVDPKKGVTFAAGLRHILRQDPDVIMVGEVRDTETARIAVQASLTGHLVLSTLHTNDAASAVARLIDLGVEPFLVSSSLSAVLAQRLARTLHRSCRGRGCPECLSTGFKGRMGVFELLVVDDPIRALINQRESADRIKATAIGAGMVPLRSVGVALVRAGLTTAPEIARVIEALTDEEVHA